MKDTSITCGITQNIAGEYEIKFTPTDPTLRPKYDKWKDRNKPTPDTSKEGSDKPKQSDIDDFVGSPLAKTVFTFMKNAEGKTWLQLVKEGKAPPLALLIAGFFGFAIGRDMFDGVMEMMPAKVTSRIKPLRRKALASRLSSKKWQETIEKSRLVVDSVKFNDYLSRSGKVSIRKGIRLKGAYDLRGKPLEVNLAAGRGGRVIFRGPCTFSINGNKVSLKRGEEKIYDSNYNKVKIEGEIPAGTVFVGEMTFARLTTARKTAPRPVPPKPAPVSPKPAPVPPAPAPVPPAPAPAPVTPPAPTKKKDDKSGTPSK